MNDEWQVVFTVHAAVHIILSTRAVLKPFGKNAGALTKFSDINVQTYHKFSVTQGHRNGSGRPSGCRTNNLTSKNFYVHIISIFENVS